jgi:hypothetical protein
MQSKRILQAASLFRIERLQSRPVQVASDFGTRNSVISEHSLQLSDL